MADPKIPYIIGVNCDADTPIILKNVSRGTSLYTVSNASGQALFDLANLASYVNGDSIYVSQAYGYGLQDGEILQSESIFYNQETISKTKIILTGNITYADIELTADGGSNWETATNNTFLSFANSGQDLRFKITANGGAVSLIGIKVEYNI